MKPYETANFKVGISDPVIDPSNSAHRVDFSVEGIGFPLKFWWPTLVYAATSDRDAVVKAKVALSEFLSTMAQEVASS